MSTILNDYNKRARPVQKETDVVNILLDIALPQVMKVDEKEEVIATNVWVSIGLILVFHGIKPSMMGSRR